METVRLIYQLYASEKGYKAIVNQINKEQVTRQNLETNFQLHRFAPFLQILSTSEK